MTLGRHLQRLRGSPVRPLLLLLVLLLSISGRSNALDVVDALYQLNIEGTDPDQLDLPFTPDKVTYRITNVSTHKQWSDLSGLLQRALLWELGLVLSSDGSALVQVYVPCEETMTSVFLSHAFMTMLSASSQNSSTGACNIDSSCNAFVLTFTKPDCSLATVQDQAQCLVLEDQVWSTADGDTLSYPLWAQEGTVNEDLDARAMVVTSASNSSERSVTINQDKAVKMKSCPSSASFIVPCKIEASKPSGFCEPGKSSLVDLWLKEELLPASSWALNTLGVLLLALWAASLMLVLGLSFVLCRRRKSGKQRRTTENMDTRSTGTTVAFASPPGRITGLLTPVSHPRWNSRDMDAINETLCHQSKALAAFRNDTTMVLKRVAYTDLSFDSVLVKGTYGEIWRGRCSDQRVAIKRLLPESKQDIDALERMASEVQTASTLEHPNIVAFVGVAWETLSELCIISEFMPLGDLAGFLQSSTIAKGAKPLTWKDHKLSLACDITTGLVYLHSLVPPLIHRDLSSRNILISDAPFEAKLSHYGIGVERSMEQTVTHGIPSILWIAPEILKGGKPSEKADIFSLGVVLCELDTCSPPYTLNGELGDAKTATQGLKLMPQISQGKIKPRFRDDCPSLLLELAVACLELEPDDRPNAMEVVYRLRSQVAASLM